MQKKINLNDIELAIDRGKHNSNDFCEMVFSGKLIGNNVSPLTKELEANFPTESMDVLVDLSNLSYVNSTGLSLLLTLWKKVINNNKRIVFYDLHPFMGELFKMTELNSKFELAEDRDSALSRLDSEG